MAFPWLFQENFEQGDRGNLDGETDTDSKLAFPHFGQLVINPPHQPPFRGAYAMHVDLSGGTNDAYVNEDSAFDTTGEVTRHLRFYFFADGLTMAASDRFDIFQLRSAAAVEAAIGIVNTAGVIQIGASETSASTQQLVDLEQGVWHALELTMLIDHDGDADGTIDFFVDGHQVGSQIASLTQTTITTARFGAMSIDAGTTAGHLLFDEIVYDDARVYPYRRRYDQGVMLTDSGHAVVGPGRLRFVTLDPGAATDCELLIYDTDEANTNDASNLVIQRLRNPSASIPVSQEVTPGWGYFHRGCYVTLSGTDPRAILQFDEAYLSEGLVKNYARQRNVHPVG